MVPTFTRVASTLKGLIEDQVNPGKPNVNANLTPYISRATLDVIALVGERKNKLIFKHDYILSVL